MCHHDNLRKGSWCHVENGSTHRVTATRWQNLKLTSTWWPQHTSQASETRNRPWLLMGQDFRQTGSSSVFLRTHYPSLKFTIMTHQIFLPCCSPFRGKRLEPTLFFRSYCLSSHKCWISLSGLLRPTQEPSISHYVVSQGCWTSSPTRDSRELSLW